MNADQRDLLPLTAHELLTTTRSVRKRLDFDRPVPDRLITDCIRDALQAPSGSNRWTLRFVVVTDPEVKDELAAIYRDGYELYRTTPTYVGAVTKDTPERDDSQRRTASSADYLAENYHRAPAIVLGCGLGRAESGPPIAKTSLLSSAMPGIWSFMLAARLRGLGTCWTTVALNEEQRLHEALAMPMDSVTVACMTPVAFTKGTSFQPALRPEPDEVTHWNRW
ncbi:nitroreductase family protein [Blastococcus sp. Marseille-P5729]|uniref:nitroreductase family protein n=1 Tax=Blastococcus sp. Marseille-P5729 TaxID=2086582 RepID=UPI000D0F9CA0|nr:nitroreductase family protein [Blastococcus sp. Marseille-P5729]